MRARCRLGVVAVTLALLGCGDVLLGVADEPPPTGDAVLDGLASQCAAGDMVDCDLLYAEAPTDSEAERYGATCGGRVETDEDCRGLDT